MSSDPTFIPCKNTIAWLRLNTEPRPAVCVLGASSIADGSGGLYFLNPTSSAADNGSTIIVDAAGHRYYLQGSGGSVGPVKFTVTQTTVTVTAVSGTLIAANANRLYLKWEIVGANPVTITSAAPAVYGTGMIYDAQGFGLPGASETFDAGSAPVNAFYAVCAAGQMSFVTVWEGQ